MGALCIGGGERDAVPMDIDEFKLLIGASLLVEAAAVLDNCGGTVVDIVGKTVLDDSGAVTGTVVARVSLSRLSSLR